MERNAVKNNQYFAPKSSSLTISKMDYQGGLLQKLEDQITNENKWVKKNKALYMYR